MELPCPVAAHGLTTVEVVVGSIVQEVEALFLSPKEGRGTGKLDGRDELGQNLPLGAIHNCWPAKHVLVRHAHHVAGVKFAGVGIDKVVFQHHVLPVSDKVDATLANLAVESVEQQSATTKQKILG